MSVHGRPTMHFAATGRLLEDQGVQASLPRTVSDELPGVGSLGPWAAQPRSVTLPRALHGGPASARVNQPRGKGLSGRFPCSRGQVARLESRGWNSTAPADGFPSGRSRLPLAKLRPGPRVPRPSLRRKSSPGRTGHSVGACGGHVYILPTPGPRDSGVHPFLRPRPCARPVPSAFLSPCGRAPPSWRLLQTSPFLRLHILFCVSRVWPVS